MNIPHSHKQKLLERVYNYANADILTTEYKSSLKYLIENIKKTQEPELFALEQQIIKCAQSEEQSDDYRRKILKSEMSFDNKVVSYKRLEEMEQYEDSDNSEFSKYKNWMDKLLSVPFGKYIVSPCLKEDNLQEIRDYVHNVRTVLDERLSFLEKPKDQIINIVSQIVRNPNIPLNAIGLYGGAGLGKTSIALSIAKALGRPFRTISLGGESDASMLLGHNFTYVGSGPGRLIDILSETKCMNPVILLDELDKVSETHHGKEIIGSLIHLTDSSTNKQYNYDRYFSGVEFDLSKVLFIFTYNDQTKIDKILSDRLFKIKLENYSIKEKLEIANKHLISNTLSLYNFTNEQIQFNEDTVEYIINSSKNDQGMRGIKRKFEIIISRINTLLLTNPDDNIVKLKYKDLYQYYKCLPIKVNQEHVDVFLSESTSNPEHDMGPPLTMYI
jgi:ATP-dependent Lon protease